MSDDSDIRNVTGLVYQVLGPRADEVEAFAPEVISRVIEAVGTVSLSTSFRERFSEIHRQLARVGRREPPDTMSLLDALVECELQKKLGDWASELQNQVPEHDALRIEDEVSPPSFPHPDLSMDLERARVARPLSSLELVNIGQTQPIKSETRVVSQGDELKEYEGWPVLAFSERTERRHSYGKESVGVETAGKMVSSQGQLTHDVRNPHFAFLGTTGPLHLPSKNLAKVLGLRRDSFTDFVDAHGKAAFIRCWRTDYPTDDYCLPYPRTVGSLLALRSDLMSRLFETSERLVWEEATSEY